MTKKRDSKDKVAWVRLFPADFLADTADLTNEEFGIYARLCMHYYRENKPLPREEAKLHRLAVIFTDSERKSLATVLERYFTEDEVDGVPVWRQKRCDEELGNSRESYETERNRTRKAREARAAKRGESIVTGSVTDTVTDDEEDSVTETVTVSVEPSVTTSTTHNSQLTTNNPTTHSSQPSENLSPRAVARVDEEGGEPSLVAKQQEHPPEEINASVGPLAPKRKVHKANGSVERKTNAAWTAYSSAYVDEYRVEPVRNATVNGMLSRFIDRVGAEAAPHVARWYVQHRRRLYVENSHPVSLLLRDAEGLCSEWKRGEAVTSTQARLADETATRGNVFRKLIAEAERKEAEQ